jgi:ABC-type phosphate transport system substrate-binding protein
MPVKQKRALLAHKKGLVAAGLVGLVATVLPVLSTGVASADYAPQPGDVVGVSGDTPQYPLTFGADGDVAGAAGFNGSGNKNRLVSFNATSDGNGRSAYTNSVTTGAASVALNPTDVLRAGTDPVQRVQSSGAAISALLADTNSPEVINYVASSSLPTSAQQTAAGSLGWNYLHVVEIGTDTVDIVADTTATNAPAGLSIAELLGIYTGEYTKWNQLPGNSSGSSDTIIPEIPPSSSAVYKTFYADLTTANGSAPTLSTSVKTVEQNDPSTITTSSNPADAIVPFSAARLALWNNGYFYNPNAVFGSNNNGTGNNGFGSAFPTTGTSTPLSPGVSRLTGTPPDGGTVYSSPITDYVIFRQSDASSATPFEPGSSLNWVQTLFSNPSSPSSPWFAKAAGKALVAAAGVTPVYNDLGDVHS